MTAGVIFKPDVMVGCLEQALADDGFDAGVLSVNLMWRVRDALAAELTALRQRTEKPFAVAWLGIADAVASQLQQANVPAFSDPTRCIRSLAHFVRWSAARRDHAAVQAHSSVVSSSGLQDGSARRRTTFAEQASLLAAHGITLAPWRLVRSSTDACTAAREIGYPVVAKVISDRLSHKSEAGAVAINLESEKALREAVARFERLQDGKWGDGGVLIQPMITGGLEVLVGAQTDPVFGPYVVLGLGGIYVELFGKPVVALAPLGEDEAARLIALARWAPLLFGARGQAKRDSAALATLIHRVSLFASRQPVASMDLNPVMVMRDGEGVAAVDFRIFWAGDRDAHP